MITEDAATFTIIGENKLCEVFLQHKDSFEWTGTVPQNRDVPEEKKSGAAPLLKFYYNSHV